MKKSLTEWLKLVLENKKKCINFSKENQILLQRDLENCVTLDDIQRLKDVLQLCREDFKQDDLITFLLNINYKKILIEYCNNALPKERYPAHEIKSMFVKTQSYAVCDAILLHIKRNKQHYLSNYQNLPAMMDTTVFIKMAERQKTILLEKFQPQKSA